MGLIESLVFYCPTFKITLHEVVNDQGKDIAPSEVRETERVGTARKTVDWVYFIRIIANTILKIAPERARSWDVIRSDLEHTSLTCRC